MSNINIGAFSEAFNNKADRDLGNIDPTAQNRATISNWVLPDYASGIAIETGYVAVSNGWVVFRQRWWSNTTGNAFVNTVPVVGTHLYAHIDSSGWETHFIFPVAKDDVVTVQNQDYDYGLTFYPCLGEV